MLARPEASPPRAASALYGKRFAESAANSAGVLRRAGSELGISVTRSAHPPLSRTRSRMRKSPAAASPVDQALEVAGEMATPALTGRSRDVDEEAGRQSMGIPSTRQTTAETAR